MCIYSEVVAVAIVSKFDYDLSVSCGGLAIPLICFCYRSEEKQIRQVRFTRSYSVHNNGIISGYLYNNELRNMIKPPKRCTHYFSIMEIYQIKLMS